MLKPVAAVIAFSFGVQAVCLPLWAENQMEYKLLPAGEAASLPRGAGTLGINVSRAQQITDGNLTLDVLRVESVRATSPGDRAGFKTGDQIIAVDGKVLTTVVAFAAYVA